MSNASAVSRPDHSDSTHSSNSRTMGPGTDQRRALGGLRTVNTPPHGWLIVADDLVIGERVGREFPAVTGRVGGMKVA
jgi:hypothetical protein